MSASELPFGMDRALLRMDADPYLALHFVIVYVRDQERAKRFYLDQLGFRLVVDHIFPDGNRWIEVAPPDGTAQIGLALPLPGVDANNLIGNDVNVYFITEDVNAKYKEWCDRGVRFKFPPETPAWGGIHTRFEDPDGNVFGLVGFDELTRGVAAQRRALAQKRELELRRIQEIEIAKQVQSRLFPQTHPAADTLEYAGLCLQAREVGGDYFDFLDLGRSRLGLVLGDVSGKGMAAALLMANLQANLRSQCANALTHPELFLRSVNDLFYQNTTDSAFASLFYAEYDDELRRLRYANCGHLGGILLRSSGKCETLGATTTLLGLFREWECSFAECQLAPGDLLALYTDGVSEASNEGGEEFGEDRLVDCLQDHRTKPCDDAVQAISAEVRRFSSSEQHDDITLIVAKCRD